MFRPIDKQRLAMNQPALLSALLFFTVAVPAVESQDLYFPTVKGSKRVMRTTLGDQVSTITETITRVESVGQEIVVTLSRENPAFEHGYGKRFNVHRFAVSPRGLFLVRNPGNESGNRRALLTLPAESGMTWRSKSHDEEQNLDETVIFKTGEKEVVSVPAGNFDAIPVTAEYVWQRDGKTVAKSKQTTWYAKEVGVVKHINYRERTDDLVTELKVFVPGEAD